MNRIAAHRSGVVPRIVPAAVCLFVFLAASGRPGALEPDRSSPVLLGYVHRPGEVLHADARVEESVYADGFFSHDAVITESSVSEVLSVDPEGTATLESVYRTEERIAGSPWAFEWVSDEAVLLTRDPRGRLGVPPDAARPVLRDIPVFPEHPVSPGDTWTESAGEVHLFRLAGTLAGPYRADFHAFYTFLERFEADGADLARIRVDYDIHLPVRDRGEPIRMISGTSSHELLWNISDGAPVSKVEDFEFFMMLADGRSREFVGRQEVTYRRVPALDRDLAAIDLRRRLSGIPEVQVEAVDEGVRLVLDDSRNVYFAPESAVISPEVAARLETLGERLGAYADRDVLVTGHTADYGTPEGRRDLSRRRAAAVAGALFPSGRPGPGKLYVRGVGSEAPTGTDAGDRRVEILILD